MAGMPTAPAPASTPMGLNKFWWMYAPFDVPGLLGRPLEVSLTKDSGLAGLIFLIRQHLGIELAKDDAGLQAIYAWMLAEFDAGRQTSIEWEELAPVAERLLAHLSRCLVNKTYTRLLLRWFQPAAQVFTFYVADFRPEGRKIGNIKNVSSAMTQNAKLSTQNSASVARRPAPGSSAAAPPAAVSMPSGRTYRSSCSDPAVRRISAIGLLIDSSARS